MQHAVLDLLGAALIPELGADITAVAAGNVQLVLVAVAALGALPHQLAVILHDLDLAVVAAALAVIRLGVQLGVHDVVVDELQHAHDRLEVVLHIGCENLKESKKLLHLTVFDGERERCILSGIAKWFKPEDLIGKKLGIVCNLAPRPMLKGKYVSEGMIFAADTADGGCSIAFYGDDTPVGSRIH